MADGDVQSSMVTNVNWNQDRSGLVSAADVQIEKVGSTAYVDHIEGSASLVGGKLVTTAKGKAFEARCELEK